MDIIVCTHTRKHESKEQAINVWLQDLRKIDKSNSKKEGETVIIRKFWDFNVCDGKLI